ADLAAVGERNRDAVQGLVQSFDACTEPEARAGDAAEQNVEQVGAVRVIIGRTKFGFRARAERRVVEAVAIVPPAIVAPLRIDTDARQRLTKAEPAKDAGGVGRELDTGANLTECFGLLEQLGVNAARPQREQRGKAADAAAGDEHPEFAGLRQSCSSRKRQDERRIRCFAIAWPLGLWCRFTARAGRL